MEHKKAVIDGVLQHVSASQIRRFRECPLKWFREKVLVQEFKPTSSMALGSKIHKYIEEGGLGLNDVIKTSVTLALQFVPSGGSHEVPVSVTIAGLPCIGWIDYYVLSSRGDPTVVDWKSTSDFARKKTRAELAVDEQAVIYSAWAMEKEHVGAVDFMHVYIHTKEPGACPVPVTVTKEMVDDAWVGLTKTVEDIKLTAGLKEQAVECKCGKCKGATMDKKELKGKLDITLYVDCLPLSGENVTSLHEYVAEANLRAAGAKLDIRLVDFGKGKGLLSLEVQNNPPSSGAYVLMTRGNDLAATVAEALIPMVKLPIRGI